MKILSMTATFGKLEHETITLQPGLNVIEAPNEWGKSTWCAFIVAMLYGIDTGSRSKKDFLADKERYAPWSGLPMSGRMDILWNDRAITIERSNKGRIPFGEFRAYETASSLPVTELTAANCGQVLLGVEKEVYTRAGFLKLSDLPVTEGDALRRRLNALVTTGDESGASDALAQKLKDLRNACRHNKTGQLPQAEAQRDKLIASIDQLQLLQNQAEENKVRQAELENRIRELENHKAALAYQANHTYAQKLAAAQTARDAAEMKLRDAEKVCAGLPTREQAEKTLVQLRQVREDWDSLHMEVQILPPPPQKPDIPVHLRDVSAVQADHNAYQEAVSKGKQITGIIAGFVLVLSGIAMSLFPGWIIKALGIAAMIAGFVLCLINVAARKGAAMTVKGLQAKYVPLSPEDWMAVAQEHAAAIESYNLTQSNYTESRADIDRRLADLKAKRDTLTDGLSLTECEQKWKAVQSHCDALENARKEYHRAAEFAQALESSHKDAAPPQFPDNLTCSEAETEQQLTDAAFELKQLHRMLGQYQGQMQALGHKADLQQQLDTVQKRIDRLEDTYAALTIAMETLASASEELQRRFAPRISQRAQALFSKLTGNRYNRLTLGADLSLSAATADEDTLHTAIWRSEGTIDQLYLALRLAVAEELTPDAPMVLDDAFVRFDDKRLAAAMDILKEESQSKQVILFTCQGREKQHL